MTLKDTKLDLYLTEDGRRIVPPIPRKTYTANFTEVKTQIDVPSASSVSLTLGDKTVKAILLKSTDTSGNVSANITINSIIYGYSINDMFLYGGDGLTAVTLVNAHATESRPVTVVVVGN